MNEVFNLNRFLQYAKTRFFSQKLYYLAPLFLVGFSILAILSDIIFDGFSGISQEVFLGFCCAMPFVGAIIFYASRTYSEFHNRSKGFIISTLPVSTFEKFLFGLLQTTIGFGLLFSISFFISLLLVIGYNAMIPANHIEIYNSLLSFANVNKMNDAPIPSPLNIFVFINEILFFATIYALGSIYFKRIGFIFTSLIMMVILWILLNITGLLYCGSAWGCNESLDFVFSPLQSNIKNIGIARVLGLIAFYISVIVLWVATFYRIKEKEY